jgi:hypothetical protein
MQGHLPGPPQPHFPEPRPLDDRPPEEPGWADAPEGVLDVFDDVGDWAPMHRPLIKVTAVILAVCLVVAGVGTVLEVLLTAR